MNNRPPSMHDGAQGEPASNGCESTQLRNQFIEAVFLIAAGLRRREELFAANPRRYPYCNELRLGIQRFAALHAQYVEDNQALRNLLDGFSESGFIRAWCTRDLSTWIEQWTPAAREELGNLECLELGPFAEVGGGFFNITGDCLEFLRLNGNGSTDDLHENRVYSMLRDAGQAAYVFGRKFLILHPRSAGRNAPRRPMRTSPRSRSINSTKGKRRASTAHGSRSSSTPPTNGCPSALKSAPSAGGPCPCMACDPCASTPAAPRTSMPKSTRPCPMSRRTRTAYAAA